ncbi:hypothetical protein C8R46DRAFT_1341997 [Mycena filopes]|nr:hypothetical protein C8R46DRAFT_1341997 [Mycena filopes]
MHRCLKLLEITDMIFSHLYVAPDTDPATPSSDRPELRDLAALARTSTVFSNVALDLLWRSAVLLNVLRCLPADMWTIDEDSSNKMEFWRPLLKTDWTRVSTYASRVRELSPGSDDLTDVLPVLSLCLPADLFPNLRTLNWVTPEPLFPHIHLFLGPTIANISFRISQSSLSLLPLLSERCPNLKNFTMTPASLDKTSYWRPAEEIQAVAALICGSKSLESISVPLIGLEHTSHLPNLKLLRVGLDTFIPGISFPAVEGPTYQALHTLQLHHTKVGSATIFLNTFREVPLASLSTVLTHPPTADENESFCAALAAGVSPASLTDLHIQVNRVMFTGGGPRNLDHRFRNGALHILTGFHNLASVTICGSFTFDLDDATDMARAWPQLVELDLADDRTRSLPPPHVTLQCLDSFARYSPRLETLAMTFDGTVVPTAHQQQAASPLVKQYSLTHMHVRGSVISRPDAVGEFLGRRFPSLREISAPRMQRVQHKAEHKAHAKLWHQVETLLEGGYP